MKLFALEADIEEKPSEMLIDKLTKQRTVEKEGISVTADLIKERSALKKELNEEFAKSGDDEEKSSNQTPDKGGEVQSEDNPSPEEKPEGEQKDNSEEESSEQPTPDEEDGISSAEDPDKLKSLIGSATSGGEAASTESFRGVSKAKGRFVPKLTSLFNGIKDAYKGYCVTLESMQLDDQKKPIQEQPVAYVKEEVLKALESLIQMAGRYTTSNETGVQKASEGIKKLSEQLTVYKEYHDKDRVSFTAKMVDSDDIKSVLSVPEKSDLRETSGILAKYLESTVSLVNKLLENKLEDIPSVLQTSGFETTSESATTIDYKNILPGFYRLSASFTPFTSYLETDYENYQIYRLKTFKLQDLYKLDHITITEDKEFLAVLGKADSIIMSVGMSLDNLTLVNQSYAKFIDTLKALCYEIEKGEKEKLTDLSLDEKMKDFIKYKLVSELYVINISMGIEYLTSLVSALTTMVEIRE